MRIGIVGGGQLGMMMAESAIKMNHQIIGLDPNPNCSLSHFADEMITADYNDKEAFKKLVEKSDVITYEFENVDLELIDQNIDKIPQKSKGLLKSRNRLIEKNYAQDLGIPTVKYKELIEKSDIFMPSIIKTVTGGYDGKGQYKIVDNNTIDHVELVKDKTYIIEEYINFQYEISVVATRDKFGNIVTYPVPLNTHRNGILFTSEVFNEIDQDICNKAVEYTEKIMTDLDYVGTLATEYFVRNNEVIFNEFAPRPHNSGHYTIEGCNVSQYDNHILAITNQKVIQPRLLQPTIMINVLGQDYSLLDIFKEVKHHIHMYKKEEKIVDRKMGHITLVFDTISEAKALKKKYLRSNYE